jgi:MerR family mercuric resistance operon transcriptional regulator
MPALAPITIAGLSSQTGVDVESIRNFERIGLIQKPRRGPGGYLLYRGEEIETVTFIKRATALGFSLTTIQELLGLADPRHEGDCCAATYEIARRQLAEIRHKIEELTRMERALSDLASSCPRDGTAARCPIIGALVQTS